MTFVPILHSTMGDGVPPVVTWNATLLEHWPGAVGTLMSPGQAAVGALCTVKVAPQVVVQPLVSVTVTVYVPLVLTTMLEVVAPVFHKNVYGAVPPLGLTVKSCEPSGQIVAFDGVTEQLGVGFTVNVALQLVEQPLVSVTVTE